jgi:hypothetical protein
MLMGMAVGLLLLQAGDDQTEAPEDEDASVIVGNREHQDALKACSGPQRHRPAQSGRIQLTMTIDGGAVSTVSVSAPKELAVVAACLEKRVKQWTFPARDDSYTVDLPVLIHGTTH